LIELGLLLLGEGLQILCLLIIKELLLIMRFEDGKRGLFFDLGGLAFGHLILFGKSRLLTDVKEIAFVGEGLRSLPF
jgi:hypothetical protein